MATMIPLITAADLPVISAGTPCSAGRQEALRVFADAYRNGAYGRTAFDTTVKYVMTGQAPQEFKEGFDAALRSLMQTVDL